MNQSFKILFFVFQVNIILLLCIISGAISGTILGIMNLGIVEPVLDKAIGIEIRNRVKHNLQTRNTRLSNLAEKWADNCWDCFRSIVWSFTWYFFYFWKKDTSWFNQSKEGHGFSWDHMVSNFLDSHVEVSSKSTHSGRS